MREDCTVCSFFKDSGEKQEIIDNKNNIINNAKTEKDVKDLFDDINSKSFQKPTWHLIKKHKDTCLKDSSEDTKFEEQIFKFESFNQLSTDERIRMLRQKWFVFIEQATQILQHHFLNYNPTVPKSNESIKESLNNIKIIKDLLAADFDVKEMTFKNDLNLSEESIARLGDLIKKEQDKEYGKNKKIT